MDKRTLRLSLGVLLAVVLLCATAGIALAQGITATQDAQAVRRTASPQDTGEAAPGQEFIHSADTLPPVGVNALGETYGSVLQVDENGQWPALTRAVGTNGKVGYIRESDIPRATTLEEAAAIMASPNYGKPFAVPLYKSDGVTIIGEFIIGSGMSEAQCAERNYCEKVDQRGSCGHSMYGSDNRSFGYNN